VTSSNKRIVDTVAYSKEDIADWKLRGNTIEFGKVPEWLIDVEVGAGLHQYWYEVVREVIQAHFNGDESKIQGVMERHDIKRGA
jgi:hypothetical protein